MSLLKLATSPLGQGTKYMLQGRPIILVRVGLERVAGAQIVQRPSFANRSFSTRKPRKPRNQASRFRKSSASAANTPAEALAATTTGAAPEILEPASNSNTNVEEPASEPSPPPRNPNHWPFEWPEPVDTSTKHYKRTERKVLGIMVGLPFLIVTSYELYQRRE